MAEHHPAPQTDASGARARAAAARALHRVRDRGQSLTRVLQQLRPTPSGPDRALIQEMVYGALRTLPRLEAIAARLLHRPLPRREGELQALILIGLYQLTAMKTPPHAAVAATVEASRQLSRPGKAGLVNALLRRFLREREALLAAVDTEPQVRWPVPEWLREQLRHDWPEDWEQIIAASDTRAPLSLRVNPLRGTRADYLAELAAAGIEASPLDACPRGLTLARARPTEQLPGFAEGRVSVQDAGAQLAAELLEAAPGMRVLDACAAPGGKSAAILERAGGELALTALDVDGERLQSVAALLDRLGLHATLVEADAAHPEGDWAAPGFERILLDVPCSATGVIRRHPDIKWLRRAEDIAALCAQQRAILEAIWPLLAPGGRLLYATCSLLADENHRQVAAFLERHPEARECPLPGDPGRTRPHGRQLLPSPGGSDGFYYALLEKPAS
ncbi:16S rRNA (cytosine(967)-C(5))-methyltransferase RsmB [Marichromatium bheemlicum]|uniref:16S rRNA (cytosine(967)-C(5))-methyltransferase RsmB n=1 Tax=Marichromatium bheemlicum TaxID=365339 RepID=UPI001FE63523|nr:16S rRNA (cytosine(967)-C(5))-methyltransferase RsmB [Marichromatium bheemlicum]